MRIKKIELKNFRQFKGRQTIEFSTDLTKNITLIIADNGTGKTTLSQAFLWCLYGESEFKQKRLLNTTVEWDMNPGDKEDVKVSLFINQQGRDYIITRKQSFEKTGRRVHFVEESFFVSSVVDGNESPVPQSKLQSEVFVKRLLPKELSKFFFFGGERIESMSKAIEDGKSKEFGDAVNGLAGLTATMKARDHFKPSKKESVIGRFDSQIDQTGDRTLSALTNQMQEYRKELIIEQNRVDIVNDEIKKYEEQIIIDREELMSFGDALNIKKQIAELDAVISNEVHKKDDNISTLLKFFSMHTLNFFSLPLIKSALEDLKSTGNLDKGIPDMRDTTVKFLLDRKFCICGTELEVGTEAYQRVYELLDVLPPKSIGQLIGDFSDNAKSRVHDAEDYYRLLTKFIRDIRENNESIEKGEAKKSECLELITDTSRVPYLKNKIREDERTLYKLKQESIELKVSINDLEAKINAITSEREKLINIEKKNDTLITYRAYARRVYDLFEHDYKTGEEKVRKELQRRMNFYLEKMFDGVIRITLDDKYNIITMISDNNYFPEGSTGIEQSTAQGYAIIFSFISSLIEMAKEKAKEELEETSALSEAEKNEMDLEILDSHPLVMDAPLSVFDKTRIKHLCEILPDIADQVVFFIKDTDGEIAEQYLTERIGMKYELVKKAATVTDAERR